MKRLLVLLICVAMLATMMAGCASAPAASTGPSATTEATTPAAEPAATSLPPVTLTLMDVNGKTTDRTDAILAKINEITLKELNVTIQLQSVAQDSYNLNLTAIEGVDLITSADYLSYYDNARKTAYLPISEEDLQKYCPAWYADNKDKLPSAYVDKKIYALPNSNPGYNAPIMILRKDLMTKYGISEVKTLDDLDKYLAAIKANEPTMTPFALDTGTTSWLLGAYAFGCSDLMAPGGPNCTSVVCFNKLDNPNYKMLRTWEQPQLVSFFKTMKSFREKGYWSQDALANPTPINEAFQSGKSGVTWATNPVVVNSLYAAMKVTLPEAQLAVFDVGAANNNPVDTYSPMGGAMSIPRSSKNYERALMFLELVYTNEDLSHLFDYGEKDIDYTLNDKGEVKVVDPTKGLGFYLAISGNSLKFKYPPEGGNWPGYDDLMSTLNARAQVNPFVGFGLDTSKVSDIAANLWNIHMEYGMPIYMGLVDDVDAAIAELNNQYEKANIAAYEQEVNSQLQNYITANGLKQTVTMPAR